VPKNVTACGSLALPKVNTARVFGNPSAPQAQQGGPNSENNLLLSLRDRDLCMQIIAYSRWDELVPHAETWDRLAHGVPFRSWSWLSTWWRHYGPASLDDPNRRLMVLGVLDASGRLLGIAPWHLERSAAKGWVLGWLGSGEVCSDYASLICMPEDADCVAETLAEYLTGPDCASGAVDCWDLFEIDGVDGEDVPVARLLEHLRDRGCSQHANSPMQAWRIALPKTWEEYLGIISKGHRKKLRRADRDLFATGRAVLHTVESAVQLTPFLDTLIDLHQKRWQSLDGEGCFASRQFTDFHRDMARQLFFAGQLQLHRLDLDGRPIAGEYQILSQDVTYSYLAGIDPQRLDVEPGHLVHAATLKLAIEQGGRALDFLRGDEPYKAHFRAAARPQMAFRVAPNRALSRLRNNVWLAGRGVKRWVKEMTR
jgi:CelD/BcsL family acetyltransferase involved in cellulose biosynthesis